MKTILIFMLFLVVACDVNTDKKNPSSNNVISAMDTTKEDTVKTSPVKEKTETEKADEALDKIMKKRKNLK